MVTVCPQSAVLSSSDLLHIHTDSGMCRERKVTNQGSVCIIAGANTESSRERRVVINLLPQQSVGLYCLPLLRTIFFEFSLRTHLFSKMIQQTHWRHIHKALYCMLFVMFESFGELITLKQRWTWQHTLQGTFETWKGSKTNQPIAKCLLSFSFAKKKKKATIMHHIMHNHGSKTMQSILDFGLFPSVQTWNELLSAAE